MLLLFTWLQFINQHTCLASVIIKSLYTIILGFQVIFYQILVVSFSILPLIHISFSDCFSLVVMRKKNFGFTFYTYCTFESHFHIPHHMLYMFVKKWGHLVVVWFKKKKELNSQPFGFFPSLTRVILHRCWVVACLMLLIFLSGFCSLWYAGQGLLAFTAFDWSPDESSWNVLSSWEIKQDLNSRLLLIELVFKLKKDINR